MHFIDEFDYALCIIYILSGRAGSALVWHSRGRVFESRCSKSCHLQAALTPCNTWSSGGTAHDGRGCDQSIGSTVSDAIVRSWLWSNATRSSPLDYFSNYCKQLIIDPAFCGSRFFIGRLLAIGDFIIQLTYEYNFFLWCKNQLNFFQHTRQVKIKRCVRIFCTCISFQLIFFINMDLVHVYLKN